MNINKGCNKLYRGKLTFLLGHKHVFSCILTCESVGIDMLLEPADHQSHFNILVNLTCMSLDYETKSRVPGGRHKGMKNMQITHRKAPANAGIQTRNLLANHNLFYLKTKIKIFEEFSRNYSCKINLVD